MSRSKQRLSRQFDAIVRRWPAVGGVISFLRRPQAMVIRVPLGAMLTMGGLLSFLPVLGIWMLPLGLLLLAVDLPFLRPPVNWTVVRGRRRWQTWQRARRRPARDGINPE